MIIKHEDFIIEKSKSGNFYDLSFETIIKKKDGTEEKEFKVVGHGMPIDTCLKKIVDRRMRNLTGEYTINDIIKIYKENVEYLKQLVYDNKGE